MRQEDIKGLGPLSSLGGPWRGRVGVDKVGDGDLMCGHGTERGTPAFGVDVVAITTPGGNWFWVAKKQMQCFTVASMLEAMGHIATDQLEGMGFVHDTWMPLNRG